MEPVVRGGFLRAVRGSFFLPLRHLRPDVKPRKEEPGLGCRDPPATCYITPWQYVQRRLAAAGICTAIWVKQ